MRTQTLLAAVLALSSSFPASALTEVEAVNLFEKTQFYLKEKNEPKTVLKSDGIDEKTGDVMIFVGKDAPEHVARMPYFFKVDIHGVCWEADPAEIKWKTMVMGEGKRPEFPPQDPGGMTKGRTIYKSFCVTFCPGRGNSPP